MTRRKRLRILLEFGGFCLIVTACVMAGYGALERFDLSGLLQTVFSLWTGVLILALCALIAHTLGKGSREGRDRRQHSDLLDAMRRIAQGDFSVLVKSDDLVHDELADAINTMARNLGNMETMRQDFISNVSHEIQSPLTSISGFAALLQKSDLSAVERMRYAGIIEAESKRLSSLSDNLLKLSSLDNNPIQRRELRLDRQLSKVILTLEPQWSAKNLSVEANLPSCTISGDEDLLSQVWVNLLVNAIKFTPEGGILCISIDGHTVTLSDTGMGIAEADLPHIFERFYKVDKSRDRSLGGNGLGLSLAKKIVVLHGGTIAARSEAGKGTTFTVTLPQNAM